MHEGWNWMKCRKFVRNMCIRKEKGPAGSKWFVDLRLTQFEFDLRVYSGNYLSLVIHQIVKLIFFTVQI